MKKSVKAYFYRDHRGRIPVIHFIDKQRIKDQAKIILFIERLETEGTGARRPLVDYLNDGIYELRIKLTDKETRILYFFVFENAVILTNAWSKKGKADKKTEYDKYMKQAKKYRKDFLQRYSNQQELENEI